MTGNLYFKYEGDISTARKIKQFKQYEKKNLENDQIEQIIERCLNSEYEKRPEAKDIK